MYRSVRAMFVNIVMVYSDQIIVRALDKESPSNYGSFRTVAASVGLVSSLVLLDATTHFCGMSVRLKFSKFHSLIPTPNSNDILLQLLKK